MTMDPRYRFCTWTELARMTFYLLRWGLAMELERFRSWRSR